MTATAAVFLVPSPRRGNIGDVAPEILNASHNDWIGQYNTGMAKYEKIIAITKTLSMPRDFSTMYPVRNSPSVRLVFWDVQPKPVVFISEIGGYHRLGRGIYSAAGVERRLPLALRHQPLPEEV